MKTWTTPADLRAQAVRLWESGRIQRAFLSSENLFPFELRLTRPSTRELSESFDEARTWIRELEAHDRKNKRYGYAIQWDSIDHRLLGKNRVPVGARIPTLEDALELAGKRPAYDRFTALATRTRTHAPFLLPWIERRPHDLLELEDDWERLLSVVDWFRSHPRPGIYARQLDLPGVHTKFIESRKRVLAELLDLAMPDSAIDRAATGVAGFERRYGLRSKPPLARFRILDSALTMQGLDDIVTPVDDLARCALPVRRVFITENEVNGLAFPACPDAIVFFGLGYGVDALSRIPYVVDAEVHYWGDIDTHGFAILDQLRAALPHVHSFLMDRETLLAHRHAWVPEPEPTRRPLAHLSKDESALYEDLIADRLGPAIRLEQERIGFSHLQHYLRRIHD